MHKTRETILLWDIDGTLLAAGNGGLEHYHNSLSAVRPTAPLPVINTHGKTDWQVIHELLIAADLSSELAPDVSTQLDRLSAVFLDTEKLSVLPHVQETLATCRESGFRNGLLTGNSEMRSRHKLGGAGLDLDLIDWDVSFFGARSRVRPDLALAARSALPNSPMIIVGDTPFDGIAAAAADIPFIAVCTGTYGREAFVDVATLAVVDDLTSGFREILGDLI
ncbi:HAD family hydrolase [Devosia elaeis]|uniref:phosphoglycolate phosphatase n=1 Tax=Devosia elaeis TaxID=1770058 RepID=A0A178HXP3_9HYPH|nr:HAD family hydrolase [Devosia elaeis]OAM77611.1 hypothetical protein A3840_08860 [Devosia elaeis]